MKKLVLISVALVLLISLSVNSFGQSLHLIIVHQPVDSQYPHDVGTQVDTLNIKKFARYVSQVCNMPLIVKEFENSTSNSSTLKGNLENYIANLNSTEQDVIWYYYTGHGSNYDGWPKSARSDIPLTDVHNQIVAKEHRLAISMFDGCNLGDEEVEVSDDFMRTNVNFIKMLFLDASGDIKSCSSKSGKGSYGSKRAGGFYTISFLEAITESSTWKIVFEKTKEKTIELASSRRRTQEPMFTDNTRIGGTYAPSDYNSKIKQGETLKDLAKRNHNDLIQAEPDYDFLDFDAFYNKVLEWNDNKTNFRTGDKVKIKASEFKPK